MLFSNLLRRGKSIPAFIQAADRQISTDLKLTANLDIKAGASEKDDPTFSLVANSGVPMRLNGFDEPVIVDFATSKFDKSVTPVIADHDTSKRVGHTTEQAILQAGEKRTINGTEFTGPVMVAAGTVSSQTQTAKDFVADSKKGYPFQVSIGAPIAKARFLEKGEQAMVNGQIWNGPLIIASAIVTLRCRCLS